MKKVKVRLLVNTAYQGPRKEGDVISVPEDFAKRWAKNGIAEYVKEEEVVAPVEEEPEAPVEDVQVEEATEEPVVEETTEEVVEEPVEEKPDYSSMNAKELYALCKEKGIEVEAKKSREYYIEKLA